MVMQIGANPAIAAHSGKFMGIRNGIDLDIWDPENDNLLPMPYTASNVAEVRLCCLLAFCEPTETLQSFSIMLGCSAFCNSAACVYEETVILYC